MKIVASELLEVAELKGMTLEGFLYRHSLIAIPAGDPVPEHLQPDSADEGDSFRFYLNKNRTIGLGINDTKQKVRVVFAQMGIADTGWISQAEALRIARIDVRFPTDAGAENPS